MVLLLQRRDPLIHGGHVRSGRREGAQPYFLRHHITCGATLC